MNFYKTDTGEISLQLNKTTDEILNFDFYEVQNIYYQFRKKERSELKEFLKGFKNIKVKNSGDRICKKYTSGGKFKKPYDLTDWLYIEVEINNITVFITFQPFDTDPNSQNIHTLANRIGISYYLNDNYDFDTIFKNMMITDIDLPLNNNKRQAIYDLICKIANI